ncbi:UDP-N-acetylmuramate dehydrogenase [Mycoplasmatota bacterium]|nr:UDP-N-acetylmuramate dehydrogenase [Mycoplasmatota bacterium]
MEKYYLGTIKKNVFFKDITTLKVGGKIKYYFQPNSFESLKKFLRLKGEVSIFIIGNGSNILASDDEYDGVVIDLSKIPTSINHIDDFFYVTANCHVASVVNYAVNKGYSGLEFLATIPAQIGGAVYMNAGAYKGEISDAFYMCECLTKNGDTVYLSKEEMMFAYRNSVLHEKEYIIINIVFKLKKSKIFAMKKLIKRRKKRNKKEKPLEFPNAGSVFKNSESYSAWKLIDSAGLREYRVNDAGISEKHANFIINCGNARAIDVKILIDFIIEKVYEKHKIKLKVEWVFVNWSD